LLAELGRLDDAKAGFDELFAILRADFAKSARLVRALANNAGFVLVATGRAKDALAAANEAVALALKISPSKSDEYAIAMWSKGSRSRRSGRSTKRSRPIKKRSRSTKN